MKCEVFCSYCRIAFFVVFGCLFFFQSAHPSNTVTLIYAGEEEGQLGLYRCGTDQVGELSLRQTVIQSSLEIQPALLKVHTGKFLDPTNTNNVRICQIALEALSAMRYNARCLGPGGLCLPVPCPLCQPFKAGNYLRESRRGAVPAPVKSRQGDEEKSCRDWFDTPFISNSDFRIQS